MRTPARKKSDSQIAEGGKWKRKPSSRDVSTAMLVPLLIPGKRQAASMVKQASQSHVHDKGPSNWQGT